MYRDLSDKITNIEIVVNLFDIEVFSARKVCVDIFTKTSGKDFIFIKFNYVKVFNFTRYEKCY